MATKKENQGLRFVIDGAFFNCPCGSASTQIKVTSHNKVYVQGKPIVTEKDLLFATSPTPFITCSKNPNTQAPICQCALRWNGDTMVAVGNRKVATEKSKIVCSAFGSDTEVVCVQHGQVDAGAGAMQRNVITIQEDGADDDDDIISELSLPEKTIVKKQATPVSTISVSSNFVRSRSEVSMTAYKDKKKKTPIANTSRIHWAVMRCTEKEVEKTITVKKKTSTVKETHYFVQSLALYKDVPPTHTVRLFKQGRYIIEGFGKDATVDGYLALKKGEDITGRFPTDANCKAVVDVLKYNAIEKVTTKAQQWDDLYYVKQNEKIEFNISLKMPFDENYDSIIADVRYASDAIVPEGEYSFDAQNLKFSLTPPNAKVDYKITFRVAPAVVETEEDKTAISEVTVKVRSYNEAVLRAFFFDLETNQTQPGNVTRRRPGESLWFVVELKDEDNSYRENAFDNYGLRKVDWVLKKDGEELRTHKDDTSYKVRFEEEGKYTIEADLKDSLLSNGGVKGDGVEKKDTVGKSSENVITHVVEITKNKLLSMKVESWGRGFFVGGTYRVRFENLYGNELQRGDMDGIELTIEEPDINKRSAISGKEIIYWVTPKKEGTYHLKATLNGSTVETSFTAGCAKVKQWEFVDSQGRPIKDIGRNMKFGIRGHVPAWALGPIEREQLNGRPRKISVVPRYNSIDLCNSVEAVLNENGSFSVDGFEVERDVIKSRYLPKDVPDQFDINFVVKNVPAIQVQNIKNLYKNAYAYCEEVEYQPGKMITKEVTLTIKKEFECTGYFANEAGEKLYNIINYGDKVTIHLRVLNAYDKFSEKTILYVYEDEFLLDSVVFEKKNIELDADGVVDIDLPTNAGKILEKDHTDKTKPRLFYFVLKKEWSIKSRVYTYPPDDYDLYKLSKKI